VPAGAAAREPGAVSTADKLGSKRLKEVDSACWLGDSWCLYRWPVSPEISPHLSLLQLWFWFFEPKNDFPLTQSQPRAKQERLH